MKLFVILCTVFSLATTAVVPEEAQAQILKYESSNEADGRYKFSYATSNGITREEYGHLVNVGQEGEHMVVEGSYSYTDVEGKFVLVKYTADENGYHIAPPTYPEISVVSALPQSVVATLLGK